MPGTPSITPSELLGEFQRGDFWSGSEALGRFEALPDKLSFLGPAIDFLAREESDTVRAWGASVLQRIGGERAVGILLELLAEQNPQRKTAYVYTRFFALRALVDTVQTEKQRKDLADFVEAAWADEAEDYHLQAEAAILLAREGRGEPLAKVRGMLGRVKEYWPARAALRGLREFPLAPVVEDVILVMKASPYFEHRRDAILALGAYTKNIVVVRALGDIVVGERDAYLRRNAVVALGRLRHNAAHADLVQALQDDDAEIRVQAARSLLSILTPEEAVATIVQRALQEPRDEERLIHLLEALRRVDPERRRSTDLLSKELGGEDRGRGEIAERILIDLGGWAAVHRLSQRRSTLDALDKHLAESETVVKSTFDDTVRQARRNFYFAMGVNGFVVVVGLVLVGLAVLRLAEAPELWKTWVVPGGTGVFAVLINLLFNNPRRNAREDLTALMNVNVIFLGFLRQLNQIDATFKHAYIESQDFGTKQMRETVEQIETAVQQTLAMAGQHLRSLRSDGRKDDEGQKRMRQTR